ncbi:MULTISPECIES: nucleoid-associated protein [unclassified Sphingobacterium]|uniref:nucleoid-associated protein n=1 Tax=unclassified Sphingobacterium TaxID=2609468 RepID=UPI0020C2B91B|nr:MULTISPECIES: nucleoid-associated protein [unclassified Sphingobacterium]MBV2225505.1 nucleoid-associated protein [Sphingobacterium mizutaii]
MFFHQDASFLNLIIHHVGNKSQDEYFTLSEEEVDVKSDEILADLLMQYFMKPFAKANEVYRFYHPNDTLDLNEVFYFSRQYFKGELGFVEYSKSIAKFLYEVTEHPKIKSGELYVVALDNVQLEGEEHKAIGIFKSENKEAYLKVYTEASGLGVNYEEKAININKLDKGVVIVNVEEEEGYKVLCVDQTNGSEAVYWKDDFLKLKTRNDNYQQTGNLMKVYKNFVNDKIDEVFDMDKADKIDLMNRSMNYFKTKETFVEDEFNEEVIGNPDAISLFKDYKSNFEDEFETPFQSNFDIAAPAVKKMASSYKSVLKLDKNFHIYVHGKRELLEKGYDEDKGMNYYKLYFENED